MSRLPIRERIKRKRRIVALFCWRMMWEIYSQVLLCTNLAFLYSLGRLAADDTPTTLARRDITNFFSALDWVNFLQFTRTQIVILLNVLVVPDIIRTDCGFVVSGLEALCVLLYRMAFPCRLKDMGFVFGLSDSCICEAFNYIIHFLDSTWGSLLDLDVGRLGSKLEGFAKALVDIGCPMSNIWGFIDGTVRGSARPKLHQRIYYNGHRRKHAVKFQGVVTPDGLFVHLFGPIVGSPHDNFLLSESGLLSRLETHMNTASGEPFCLHGDCAYNACPHLSAPFSETRPDARDDRVQLPHECMPCNGRVGLQGDNEQVGLCCHETAAKGPAQCGGQAVQGCHPPFQLALVLERGQRNFSIFRRTAAFTGRIPWGRYSLGRFEFCVGFVLSLTQNACPVIVGLNVFGPRFAPVRVPELLLQWLLAVGCASCHVCSCLVDVRGVVYSFRVRPTLCAFLSWVNTKGYTWAVAPTFLRCVPSAAGCCGRVYMHRFSSARVHIFFFTTPCPTAVVVGKQAGYTVCRAVGLFRC